MFLKFLTALRNSKLEEQPQEETSPYKFSRLSLNRLDTCDPVLQALMIKALKDKRCPCDFTIVSGHRGKEEQNKAYRNGYSKLKFPQSKHNSRPSKAVDICPYVNGKLDWKSITNFKNLGNHILTIAKENDISVTWGGNWKKFKDYPHYEL